MWDSKKPIEKFGNSRIPIAASFDKWPSSLRIENKFVKNHLKITIVYNVESNFENAQQGKIEVNKKW